MKPLAYLIPFVAYLSLSSVYAQGSGPSDLTAQEKEYVRVLMEQTRRLRATDERYEDNWRIAADDLQRELSELCARLLPATGTPLEDVLNRYGKPKEMYEQNSFKIRKLVFPFDTPGRDKSVFPMEVFVTFVNDKALEAFFTDPNIRFGTRISSRGIERYPDTQQDRFNLLFLTVEDLRRAEKFRAEQSNKAQPAAAPNREPATGLR